MSFRMAALTRSKTGTYVARKGIPKDVRAEYERLYGHGWEAKWTLPAATRPQEAKARHAEWVAEVETRIASIRAARNGEGQSLTKRNAHALAGEWYQGYVARHEKNPGTPEHWRTTWDVLISELEDHAAEEVHEKPWRDLGWTRDPKVRAGIRPVIADEAKTAQFLASKGVVLNGEAQALFLDCVLDEFIAATLLLERRALGERPWQFPKFNGQSVKASTGLKPMTLFAEWIKARQPAPSGVNRWRPVFLDLDKRFNNADDITEHDAREWAKKLVTPERGARTVNDVWVTGASTIFAWAVRERMVTSNPFKGLKVTEPRRVQHRETKAFTPEEAATILRPLVRLENQVRPLRVQLGGCPGYAPILVRERGKLRSCAGRTFSSTDRSMR